MTTPKWPTPELAPDPAAQELLAPAPDASNPMPGATAHPTTAHPLPASAADQPDAFLRALQDGTIPVFDDLPDATPPMPAPPVDLAAERAAYSDLLDFINQHKDPGTRITCLDPDSFADGLN